MKNSNIKHIIFDLGDVILNINVPLAYDEFVKLSGKTKEEILESIEKHQLYHKFETGQISENEFRNMVRVILDLPEIEDATIDASWNILLLDLPIERIALLENLAKNYQLFLLSNTSSIHITEVNKILERTSGHKNLNALFTKVFLSYEMGLMKPDLKIYQDVLQQAGIEANETLFLDDNPYNIAAAASLGIHAIHVQKPTSILEYLKDYAV